MIDRRTLTIKWSVLGATQFQHDPDFNSDGTVTALDNRGYAPPSAENGWIGERGGSRIVAMRPEGGAPETLYQTDDRNKFYTPRRGKHQRLDNGDVLITETDAGRAFEVTPSGEVVWEYLNRYGADEVGWLMTADRYPPAYAHIGENCPAN